MQELQPHLLGTFLGQNFSKFRRNLGKIEAKYGQIRAKVIKI